MRQWLGLVAFMAASSGVASPDYGDFSGFGSASSDVNINLRMGALVDDTETAATVNSTATADDLNGSDDEDGVTLPASVQLGQSSSMTVNVTNLTGSTSFLSVWIDFNRNGVLTDPGEQIASNVTIASGTSNSNRNLSFTVPAAASLGNAGVRVRLSGTGNPGDTGHKSEGEVEDYLLSIEAVTTLDYGDLPDPAAGTAAGNFRTLSSDNGPSHVVNANLRLGATVTNELEALQNATATGDVDDGIPTLPNLAIGQTGSLPVLVTNTNGSTAYLHVWVDFDNNGVLGDAGEKMTVVPIPTGTNNVLYNVSMPVPSSAVAGSRGMRLRLSTNSVEASTGASGPGEVEDCFINVYPWQMSIGGQLWQDTNNNGIKNTGEGVNTSGALVRLFDPGADNAIGGTGANADVQVGSTQTVGSSGTYVFTGLTPGRYFVQVTPPAGFLAVSAVVATLDDNVMNNNDGVQPGGPGTLIYSPIIDLQPGTESVTDGDTDSNTNLTVGVGLFSGITLGNLVWNDVNNDGSPSGESGVPGMTVQLLTPGTDNAIGGTGAAADTVVDSVVTDSSGLYQFLIYTPGRYFLRLTPIAGYPAAGSRANADNGSDNDDNGSQPGGLGTFIYSPVLTLTAGGEPGSSGNTNVENTIDVALRPCATLTLSPTTLPDATQLAGYTTNLTASGGSSPYTYTISAGALPTGLTLSSGGILAGTATAAPGDYTFTVRATDVWACTGTRSHTLRVVCPVISVTTPTLPAGMAGTAYSQTLTATGGSTPYTWTRDSGTLPAGLTLSSGGVLSGTPSTSNGGGVSVTFRVTDAFGCTTTQAINVQICSVLTLAPTSLPASTMGVAYSQTITATGGASPYTYSVSSGTLPTGLTLSSAGVLSGVATSSTSRTFTLRATDVNGCAGTRSYTLTPVCWVPDIAPGDLGTYGLSANVNVTFTATIPGGFNGAPYTWNVSAGTLPPGVTLSTAGVLGGSGETAGDYAFTVRATDVNGCSNVRACTMKIASSSNYDGVIWFATQSAGVGYLETLTLSSGSKTLIGTTSDTSNHNLLGLAWSPDDRLFGLEIVSPTSTRVYQVDPETAAVTLRGSLNGSFNGMVFRNNGTPFITSSTDGGIYSFNLGSLSTSNVLTPTLAAAAPATAPNGLAFVSAGDIVGLGADLFYAAGGGSGNFYLYKLPAGSANMQLVGEIRAADTTAIPNVYGLGTDGFGTIYAAAGNQIYDLNPVNAVARAAPVTATTFAIRDASMRSEYLVIQDDYGDFSRFGEARNTVSSNLRIGALTDAEVPGANDNATDDDLSGVDDEDGVTHP